MNHSLSSLLKNKFHGKKKLFSRSLMGISSISIFAIQIIVYLFFQSAWGFSAGHNPSLISIGSSFIETDNISSYTSISTDNGRYVAFASYATNLVNDDTNNNQDIFVYDRESMRVSRISVNSSGEESNGDSYEPAISADGRYVAFSSIASNLVSDDTNNTIDIFLYDRQTGITSRVSVDSNGNEANSNSLLPSVSKDGNYIVFQSAADNLVDNDTNHFRDVFLYNRANHTTTIVSAKNGTPGNALSWKSSISADGNYVAYISNANNLVDNDTNGASDVFLYNTQNNTTIRISVDSNGNESSGPIGILGGITYRPSLSEHGDYIAFNSSLTDLVPGDNNSVADIFVYNRNIANVVRVSINSSGDEGDNFSDIPAISPDGRYVAFRSSASNLVSDDTNGRQDVFLHDLSTHETRRLSIGNNNDETNNMSDYPSISSGGHYISYTSYASNLVNGDTNDTQDIFVRNMNSNKNTKVSKTRVPVTSNGVSQLSSASNDGRYIAFVSDASNLVEDDTNNYYDIFVYDSELDATQRISVDSSGNQGTDPGGFGFSFNNIDKPSISADGRYVAFSSDANNLVTGDLDGDLDIFVHDRTLGTTIMVSVNSSGVWANNSSIAPSISADGRYVTFSSFANNLVPGDTNGRSDIFVHDIQTGITTRESISTTSTQGNHDSLSAVLSEDGRYVAFWSFASNLVIGDTNAPIGGACPDVFIRDRQLQTTTIVNKDNNGTIGNSCSYDPSISADGRYIAFTSWADNLVTNDTNGYGSDIFIHDTVTQTTTRISVDSLGIEANANSSMPSISADGRYVAFSSDASNLDMMATLGEALTRTNSPQIYIHDTLTHTTRIASVTSLGLYPNNSQNNPSIAADGQTIAWTTNASDLITTDTNGVSDIYNTPSYINVATPIVSNSSISFIIGTTGTSTISLTGTSIANEQLSLIARQYDLSGTIVKADLYTGIVDNGGIWSIPITLDNISGSIDIVTSLYDTRTHSNISRKAGPSSIYSFSPILAPSQPTVVISSTSSNITNTSPIPITITFSEAVSGFTDSDISVTNSTINNFTIVSTSVYTFDLVPSSGGIVTVDITGGVAMNSFGGNNTAAVQLVRTYVIPSTPSNNGGGGGGGSPSLSPDICPNEIDTSPSYYDNRCNDSSSGSGRDNIVTGSIISSSSINKCYYSDAEAPTNEIIYKNIMKSPYKEAIIKLFSECIIQGNGNVIYNPRKIITRGELIKIAFRAERLLPKTFNQFDAKYTGKVRWIQYMKAAYKNKSTKPIVAKWLAESIGRPASKNDISAILHAINPVKYKNLTLSGKGGLSRGVFAHIIVRGDAPTK